MSNIFVHEGVTFDLDGDDWADVLGVVWSWTGRWSPAGEPMLRGGDPMLDLPLPDVYHYHGPLIPISKTVLPTRRGPSAGFLATLAAGYVETDEQYAARIGGL